MSEDNQKWTTMMVHELRWSDCTGMIDILPWKILENWMELYNNLFCSKFCHQENVTKQTDQDSKMSSMFKLQYPHQLLGILGSGAANNEGGVFGTSRISNLGIRNTLKLRVNRGRNASLPKQQNHCQHSCPISETVWETQLRTIVEDNHLFPKELF